MNIILLQWTLFIVFVIAMQLISLLDLKLIKLGIFKELNIGYIVFVPLYIYTSGCEKHSL